MDLYSTSDTIPISSSVDCLVIYIACVSLHLFQEVWKIHSIKMQLCLSMRYFLHCSTSSHHFVVYLLLLPYTRSIGVQLLVDCIGVIIIQFAFSFIVQTNTTCMSYLQTHCLLTSVCYCSVSLCHSAICFLGQFMTSFQ